MNYLEEWTDEPVKTLVFKNHFFVRPHLCQQASQQFSFVLEEKERNQISINSSTVLEHFAFSPQELMPYFPQ